jgi:hypothetical protein
MAVAALKKTPQLKTFYATMHVTRVEEWFVEAETVEEARELLLSGAGHRNGIRECIHAEVEQVARYAPRWTRSCKSSMLLSRFAS